MPTSCSDDGTVFVRNISIDDDQGTPIYFNEKVSCVCVEDISENNNNSLSKRDRTFVAGKVSGHYDI